MSCHFKSDSPDCFDILLTRICLRQFFPQITDMDIDCIILSILTALPDLLIETLTGIDLFRVLH